MRFDAFRSFCDFHLNFCVLLDNLMMIFHAFLPFMLFCRDEISCFSFHMSAFFSDDHTFLIIFPYMISCFIGRYEMSL
jgi:hypothetical protein